MIVPGYLHRDICCVGSSSSAVIAVDAVEDDCEAGDAPDSCAGDDTGFLRVG